MNITITHRDFNSAEWSFGAFLIVLRAFRTAKYSIEDKIFIEVAEQRNKKCKFTLYMEERIGIEVAEQRSRRLGYKIQSSGNFIINIF